MRDAFVRALVVTQLKWKSFVLLTLEVLPLKPTLMKIVAKTDNGTLNPIARRPREKLWRIQ